MNIPDNYDDALAKGRSSQNVGYKYACFVMALTFRPQSIEAIGPEIYDCFKKWLESLTNRMEMAFAAFDQIISILPRSVETYYIFGRWLEGQNLLLSAITQQRTALLIKSCGLNIHIHNLSKRMLQLCINFKKTDFIPSRRALSRLSSKICDSWHICMLNDKSRNFAFVNGLQNYLSKNRGNFASVLDLGSGTGLLGIAADLLGANKVTCCEFNSPLAELSKQIGDSNETNIEVFPELSTALNIRSNEEKYDCLVTEIFDCALLGEDAIRSILDAHKRLLKSNAYVIPSKARIFCQAGYSKSIDLKMIKDFKTNETSFRVGSPFMSRVKPNNGSGHEPYEGERLADLTDFDANLFTEKKLMTEVDFRSESNLERMVENPEKWKVEFKELKFPVNILIVTFELDIDDRITINNEIGNPGCWEQTAYALWKKYDVGQSIEAEFLIECNGPILKSVKNDGRPPDVLVSGRQIALYHQRETHLEEILMSEFLIWVTPNLDIDIIAKNKKKIFLIYPETKIQEYNSVIEKAVSTMNDKRVLATFTTLPLALLQAPSISDDEIFSKIYFNFLDEFGMTNWLEIEKYISGYFTKGLQHAEAKIIYKYPLRIEVFYQVVTSDWLEDRILLKDSNLPNDIEIANSLNSLQLMDYPFFNDFRPDIIQQCGKLNSCTIQISSDKEYLFSSKMENYSNKVSGILYWLKIERNTFIQVTEKCCYTICGIELDSTSHQKEISISGKLCFDSTSYCPDNYGISFKLNR